MFLERGDVNPDQPDTNYDRTPLSWAAKNGHHRVVKMLRERVSVNSDTTDRVARHPSPPPLAIGASAVDLPFRGGNPNSDTTDTNGQHALLSADPNQLELVLGLKDSPPKPADRGPPPTEQPRLHQPPPTRPLRNAATMPNDAWSILAYDRPADRYFTIACFVCLVAFFVYIISSSLPETFPLHK
ncbi:hypothetical protein HOY80DRAFT_966225 [Tuber brumale]|nr:hypothetical protein HOY80DRAFT_966225 [Tuber brumale]